MNNSLNSFPFRITRNINYLKETKDIGRIAEDTGIRVFNQTLKTFFGAYENF